MGPESCVIVFEELLLAANYDEEVRFDGSGATDMYKEIRHED